jgi:type VI secretion system protein ImpA
MSTPAVLDFETLLAPITVETPAGPPLRGDDATLNELFYQVSNARKEAQAAEKQLLYYEPGGDNPMPTPKPPDWKRVVDLATEAIATKSKDLWVAAWLIEGLCRTDGFAGLRDGFRATRELSERYWDSLHPRPDSEPADVGTTVRQLTGVFDGVLTAPIHTIPLTGSSPPQENDRTPRYSLRQHQRALQLDKVTDPKQRRQQVEKGALTSDDFKRAVEATSADAFRNRLADIDECLAEFNSLVKELDKRCGEHAAPPASKVREALQECRTRLVSIAGSKLAEPQPGPNQASGDTKSDDKASGEQVVVRDGFASREDALQTLLKVADYFRKNERHSIVPYSLEQVVRWGRMSLPELLTELIGDKKVRQEMFRHTGISGPSGKDEGSSE